MAQALPAGQRRQLGQPRLAFGQPEQVAVAQARVPLVPQIRQTGAVRGPGSLVGVVAGGDLVLATGIDPFA